jgi:hypothetical protein
MQDFMMLYKTQNIINQKVKSFLGAFTPGGIHGRSFGGAFVFVPTLFFALVIAFVVAPEFVVVSELVFLSAFVFVPTLFFALVIAFVVAPEFVVVSELVFSSAFVFVPTLFFVFVLAPTFAFGLVFPFVIVFGGSGVGFIKLPLVSDCVKAGLILLYLPHFLK